MNEGIHLDLDTWIVPGQIRKANLCRGLGNRYTPEGQLKAYPGNIVAYIMLTQERHHHHRYRYCHTYTYIDVLR